ncbi:ATP-dependent RNA helicase DRS1 [Striga asiatica]|uniref:ATP-dependent RNA helicase DRS1 n=1 Tax=Striga asiatica TaxID=4170 RepID=A0A5A7RA93_STRAF|nr:ATP-dependent RNA helicase DRS1 [Striga asiatica]
MPPIPTIAMIWLECWLVNLSMTANMTSSHPTTEVTVCPSEEGDPLNEPPVADDGLSSQVKAFVAKFPLFMTWCNNQSQSTSKSLYLQSFEESPPAYIIPQDKVARGTEINQIRTVDNFQALELLELTTVAAKIQPLSPSLPNSTQRPIKSQLSERMCENLCAVGFWDRVAAVYRETYLSEILSSGVCNILYSQWNPTYELIQGRVVLPMPPMPTMGMIRLECPLINLSMTSVMTSSHPTMELSVCPIEEGDPLNEASVADLRTTSLHWN